MQNELNLEEVKELLDRLSNGDNYAHHAKPEWFVGQTEDEISETCMERDNLNAEFSNHSMLGIH